MTKTFVSLLLFITLLSFNLLPTVVSNATNSQNIPSQGILLYHSATPLLGGWGGVRLHETVRYTEESNDSQRTSPESVVFHGEVASNAEMVMQYMTARGYNTVRAYWEPPTSQQAPDWGYNDAWMQKLIDVARALDMWVIVDCHGYYDHYQYEEEWIGFWEQIISKFKDSYEKIAWAPINEPVMQWKDGSHELTGQTAVHELARIYQRWINMCRGLGDTHWMVVSGVEWWNSLPPVDWFPVVDDPLNKVYYDWHLYYFYEDNPDAWSEAEAQANADYWFDVITQAMAKYDRPFLCTEMGAAYSYTDTIEPPDVQYRGAASYTNVTLAFIQRLITHFDNYPGRIGYILWSAGDWAKDWSGGWHYGGLYGGMDVWGHLLAYKLFS